MARAKQVTRTITSTVAQVLCMDITAKSVESREFVLSGTFKNDDAVLKQVTKVLADDNIKAVAVESKNEVEKLYAMSEQEFITNAREIDPKTRK